MKKKKHMCLQAHVAMCVGIFMGFKTLTVYPFSSFILSPKPSFHMLVRVIKNQTKIVVAFLVFSPIHVLEFVGSHALILYPIVLIV